MTALTVRALRAVLVVLLAGSVLVQALMVALPIVDADDGGELAASQRASAVIIVLGVATVQAVLVFVWRLVTMVQRGTVFSEAAFGYVDAVIGAVVAAAFLVTALAFVLAPGEAVPPGAVLMLCGAAVAVLGVALVVLVLRMLLAQAVARDVQAAQMEHELNAVI
jgi:hypothetical protein